MADVSAVRLLEIEPDLGRLLSAEEREEAQRLAVPLYTVPRSSVDVIAVLGEAHAFGALVVDGMLLQRLRVADHTALRLLGPGDIASRSWMRSMMLTEAGCHATARTTLAMLGSEVLVAARRWPRIVAGLHARMVEQSERLATQLVICQFPRVEDRLLALLWLLAESWGQVTIAGTTLPISLTHDALGMLIGARRSTVTLALGELSDRGAIVRQDRGWLLLEALEGPHGEVAKVEEPGLVETFPSAWTRPSAARVVDEDSKRALREAVERLREQHSRNVDRFQQSLQRGAGTRGRSVRPQRLGALRRPQAPS